VSTVGWAACGGLGSLDPPVPAAGACRAAGILAEAQVRT
jgi:hypothetical protein